MTSPNGPDHSEVPTLKEAPARRLRDEARDDLARVVDVVESARSSLPAWDNLAFIKAFVRAADRARPVFSTTTNPLTRRLLGEALLRLVPPALLPAPWSTSPPQQALHLDDDVLLRADDGFALRRSDAPRTHPSWSAFLARPGLVDRVLEARRHETLLAPRSLSPGAEDSGSAVLVRVDEARLEGAAVRVLVSDGTSSARRKGSDGKDAGEAIIKLEVLRSWLENAGPGARALDLRKADDRCLWLTFQSVLRARRLDVLLAKEAQPARRADVVDAVIDAAADAVAVSCLDPLSCRFVLPPEEQHPWSKEAARLLLATGLFVEVAERSLPRSTRAASSSRHLVWLDAVVDGGIVGGCVSAVAQARAFGRLAVSFLAPLGALPTIGSKDGRGVVITIIGEDEHGHPTQRGPMWIEPAWVAGPVTPLLTAWKEGRGRWLPEPRGAFAHDVKALPAWLGHFTDAIGVEAAAEGETP